MADIALIRGGLIDSIIVADLAFAKTLDYDRVEDLAPWREAGIEPGVGWRWNPVLGPQPPVEQGPNVPQRVTRKQAKLALDDAGLLATVESVIATRPLREQLEWTDSLTFDRTSGALLSIASALGLTPSQIDDLFIQAATYTN